MRLIFVSIFYILTHAVLGADPKYPVSSISEELKKNVDVVFRQDKMVFKINSQKEATLYVHQVVTIFNEKGKHYASEVIGYDKLTKVVSFKGTAYDAAGNIIKKLKSSEIYDQSSYDGFSLYSDNRLKAANLSQGAYPYTVEYEYEILYKYLFQIPGFVVVSNERTSVEESSYELIYPVHLKPRYKTINIDTKPEVTVTKEAFESTKWSFKNVMPIKFEAFGPPRGEVISSIMAGPTTFEYDGYTGVMNEWNDLGRWISSLNKGRDVLPEATKIKVKQLVSEKNTQEEKIKVLYEYMQNKTRYVSIQLGIGGFQPFEATVVDNTGYGDCKALSNYMVAMLDVAGIKSHYALIRAGAGSPKMVTDFPSSQFNHAVVAVPNGADTLWLECTSQTNPFGYIGTFTGDRQALIITNDGAKIVNTTAYSANENTQVRKAKVTLLPSGDGTAKIETVYSGTQYENDGLSFILDNQFDEQKKWIEENTSIASFDIKSFSMKNVKAKIPSAVVTLDLNLRKLASVSGKRLFVTPNLMNRSTYVPEKIAERKTNVVRRTTYMDVDSIHYELPEGIYPEFLPEPVVIKTVFGEYEASYKVDDKGLLYIRRVKMNKGEFPASSYPQMIDFYKNISKADNTKLVFLNKT